MALCTVQNVKDALGISGSTQDSLISFYLAGADAAIKKYCHREFEQKNYVHYLDGTGLNTILLNQTPVQSVASIYLDQSGYYGSNPDGFAASTILTAGTDYALMPDMETDTTNPGWSLSGLIRRLGLGIMTYPYVPFSTTLAGGVAFAIWPVGLGNIKVTYTAGYATIPGDVIMACTNFTIWLYNSRTMPGFPLQSESLGAYSYSLLANGGPGSPPEFGTMRMLLSGYKRRRLS